MFNIKDIPQHNEREDSTREQMDDLIYIANRLGMKDAVTLIESSILKEEYGCHVEPWEGIDPDCVCDYENYEDCIYAKPGMIREQCKYWKKINKGV